MTTYYLHFPENSIFKVNWGCPNFFLYEFKLLSDHDQYDILFSRGVFVTSIIWEDKRFAVYTLYKFFVELEYNPTTNKIVNKISFVSGRNLDKYGNVDVLKL